MPLAQRLSRLLRADAHAVLDRIEAPREMLRQSIRDMWAAIGDGQKSLQDRRQQLATVLAAKERAATLLDALAEELDLCLDQQRSELARDVIRRKLSLERRQKIIQDDELAIADEIAELEQVLAEQQQSLDALREAAAPHLRSPSGDAHDEAVACADEVSENDVEIALLREQRRREAP